jgi:glycosyltransferase involved in cell wall biosynthesis
MMIAIVIATYKRKDGKTPFYLTRALNSIMVQTYKEWDVYLIGDNYEDEDELYNIAKDFENVDVINLAEAKERNKYPFGDYRLFCAGGVNAALYGVT